MLNSANIKSVFKACVHTFTYVYFKRQNYSKENVIGPFSVKGHFLSYIMRDQQSMYITSSVSDSKEVSVMLGDGEEAKLP